MPTRVHCHSPSVYKHSFVFRNETTNALCLSFEMQLELEKLLGRKWTEDSDVISCNLCRKEFSLIVRKHHCRNCGQIFCNECSSKMAPITSNKKPVRVCDSCYNELGSKQVSDPCSELWLFNIYFSASCSEFYDCKLDIAPSELHFEKNRSLDSCCVRHWMGT